MFSNIIASSIIVLSPIIPTYDLATTLRHSCIDNRVSLSLTYTEYNTTIQRVIIIIIIIATNNSVPTCCLHVHV